jgi:hypothetical protein
MDAKAIYNRQLEELLSATQKNNPKEIADSRVKLSGASLNLRRTLGLEGATHVQEQNDIFAPKLERAKQEIDAKERSAHLPQPPAPPTAPPTTTT